VGNTATTAIPASINYLYNLFNNDVTLGAANPPVLVLDGPVASQQYSPLMLWVGLTNLDSGGSPDLTATGTQRWGALGKFARIEMFTVNCVAQAWSGVSDMLTVRTAAFGIVSAVEDLVRVNANLGGNVLVVLPGVTGHQLQQGNNSGAYARVSFQITCEARLVS
jgi:hypothetical protein